MLGSLISEIKGGTWYKILGPGRLYWVDPLMRPWFVRRKDRLFCDLRQFALFNCRQSVLCYLTVQLNENLGTNKYTWMIWFIPCRLKKLVEYFKMALDCFFAVWFVIGNVWVFGRHSSSSEAPKLYRYSSHATSCSVFYLFFLWVINLFIGFLNYQVVYSVSHH